MKPLQAAELQKLVEELKTLEGAKLQEVILVKDRLVLGLYLSRIFWLVFDLKPASPQLALLDDRYGVIPKKGDTKPLVLFLNAHFIGDRISSIEAPSYLGRVLVIHFSAEKSIEVRLFSKGVNAIVHIGKRSVALAKPLPLAPQAEKNYSPNIEELSLQARSQEWLLENKKNSESQKSGSVSSSVNKLTRALSKIETDIQSKKDLPWRAVGQWLVENQTLNVPEKWKDFVDLKKTFAENVENCFQKSKELRLKIERAEARQKEIAREIAVEGIQKKSPHLIQKDQASSLLYDASAKGRSIDIGDELRLFIGKSAKDNALLRRKAKPWYIWLHIRGIPSAHGIIQCLKTKKLTPEQLHFAAHHLIAQSFGSKQKDRRGEKFEIMYAECRHVHAIKGAQEGLVTYKNESTFVHVFKSS